LRTAIDVIKDVLKVSGAAQMANKRFMGAAARRAAAWNLNFWIADQLDTICNHRAVNKASSFMGSRFLDFSPQIPARIS